MDLIFHGFILQTFRNDEEWVMKCLICFFSLQLWWRHPWHGGLRHRWAHLRPAVSSHISLCDLNNPHISISLFADITVICPWEAFNHLELHELAQYGIIWALVHLAAIPWGLQATSSMHFKPSASGSSVSSLYMELFQQTTNYHKELQQTQKMEKQGKNVQKKNKQTFCLLPLDSSSSDSAALTQHLLMFRICCFDSHDVMT